MLTAINGSGKTTLLSHIVDSFYEMARPHFPNEFEERENKYYRVSSSIYNIDYNQPSIVYLRFMTEQGNVDYIDIRNQCTEEHYNESIELEGKITYGQFSGDLQQANGVKKLSNNWNQELAWNIFNKNVLTFFSPYRYEAPGYLNDPYKVSLDFRKTSGFSGYLRNPIEVVSGLEQFANWILDIVLDLRLTSNPNDQIIFLNLNTILTQTLISRNYGNLRFGIGPRGLGSTRIQVMEQAEGGKSIYPSIFNLSSGESALLCLFGELLRQGDNIQSNIPLNNIYGIVLVDEVDKHLHIKLQKEILPTLINIFPNVQFIMSSHSPFLSMGLAEVAQNRSKIIDLDNLGISTDPTSNELYLEVYNMMIGENDRFKELYEEVNAKIEESEVPLIITEGKTDVQHLKKAQVALNIEDCNIDYYEIADNWGDSKLKILLEQLSKVNQNRRIIGIFDRDVASIVGDIEQGGQHFKNYSNNVFAFCIPVPPGREDYQNISIEFYYSDQDIKKEKDGKSLFFDNEIDYLFNKSTNRPEFRRLDEKRIEDEHSKKIFDEQKMCEVADWIHSKANFANLVLTDEDFNNEIDFSSFELIFDRIKEIIALN
ncbi:AAA family ATPase [Picosynechococcus sp. PCC 8807]|uniref:AAA family ATPase n=1 Tax=Picosynechococcus sp. PCC 8807 TaxID=195248 RepID=UPI0030DB76DF